MSAAGLTGVWVGSDLHVGSEGFMAAQFAEQARAAHAKGVRVGLLPGDLLDGDYGGAHGLYEQTDVGFARQAKAFVRALPKLKGWAWYSITGNHDHTFFNRAGIEAGPVLEQMAREAGHTFTYLGDRVGRVQVAGAAIELWHPSGGGNGVGSLERRCAGYARGDEPDLLLVGHFHQYAHLEPRGVHAVLCPTFQHGCSSFGRSMARPQSEGGVEVWFRAGAPGRGLEVCASIKTKAAPRGAMANIRH